MTADAMTFFPDTSLESLGATLVNLQVQAQALFAPQCWISGDPNPLNWGLRNDGTAVLFDWERFGQGSAALDLAITAPGLVTPESFQLIAERYLQAMTGIGTPQAVTRLSRDIALAKVWSIVEFLSMVRAGIVANTAGVTRLVKSFPDWLATIRSADLTTDAR